MSRRCRIKIKFQLQKTQKIFHLLKTLVIIILNFTRPHAITYTYLLNGPYLPFFLLETFCLACPPSYEVVRIALASAKGEFFAFPSHFVKIESSKGSFTRTDLLWKLAGTASRLACVQSFEVVCIAAASTVDELFAFSNHFVKIEAWKECLTWTDFLL